MIFFPNFHIICCNVDTVDNYDKGIEEIRETQTDADLDKLLCSW